MSREETREKGRYYTIVGGTFRVQVDKDDPKAVRRDWTSSDGKKSGTKYERIVNALYGFIEYISFVDGEYGEQLLIKLDANEDDERPVIALQMASREAESFLKRLPNVDLSKEVRLRPYSFEDDGDEVRGIEVLQPDANGEFNEKIGNFFRTDDGQPTNGYPVPEGDTEDYSKDDWKVYFLQARKFVKNYVKVHICPKFAEGIEHTETPKAVRSSDYPTAEDEGINPDEIPF